ncbi:uncharacterized protein LOC116251156 [Nymphaea colorata]|nr:uncharacterized protein LOC116251156 [Nymphaea colorata]
MAELRERKEEEEGEEEEEEERLLEEMAVIDFDMLCATVALQTRGFLAAPGEGGKAWEAEGGGGGGVQRMWEGDVLDCFQDQRIAIDSFCCPCCTFGKNMKKTGFGSCLLQGTMHLFLSVAAFLAYVAFGVTRQYYFLYIAIALTISVSLYLGYFRRKMRQHFNIRGSDSPVDDCLNHLLCPCCTLCQETRTLNLNNVRDGTWHGRGDTICIGSSGAGTGTSFELRQTPAVLTTKSPEVCRIERPEP